MDAINHILAHQFPNHQQVLLNHRHVLQQLVRQRLITQLENEQGTESAVMHRWNLRLNSLVAPSVTLSSIRSIGFQLLYQTYSASPTSFLSTPTNGKTNLNFAINLVTSPKTDPQLFHSALQLIQLIFAKSLAYPEWARENVGATVVQKTVNALIQQINNKKLSSPQIPFSSLEAILTLIPLFPTALRPLATSLHTLAIESITSNEPTLLKLGTDLFASLYLLSPKGRDGLREAWKRGIESLIGSIDGLIVQVTQDVFVEDPDLKNHELAPLALPAIQLHSTSSSAESSQLVEYKTQVLERIQVLSFVLRTLLKTPTTDRAGSVPVPIGALVELGLRLISLTTETSIRDVRYDPSVILSIQTYLPRLQMIGCQILTSVSSTVGLHLAPHSEDVLSALSRTLSTYSNTRSPMRSMLTQTYALVVDAIGSATIDPEEAKRSLARVWRVVLEDIGAVSIEPTHATASTSSEKDGSNSNGVRKTKKQKTSYDPSESLALSGKRPHLDEIDLEMAIQSLQTLNRLLSLPFSHFLPAKLQLATSRLLVFICLSYISSTSTSFPTAATTLPLFAPFPKNPTASTTCSPLFLALQYPTFLPLTLQALLVAFEHSLVPQGTIEFGSIIFSTLLLSSSAGTNHRSDLSTVARKGLAWIHQSIIHPQLAVTVLNTQLLRQTMQSGGAGLDGLGTVDEESLEEFAVKLPRNQSEDQDDESMSEEEEEADEEAQKDLEKKRRKSRKDKQEGMRRKIEMEEVEREKRMQEKEKQDLEQRQSIGFTSGVFGTTPFGKSKQKEEGETVGQEDQVVEEEPEETMLVDDSIEEPAQQILATRQSEQDSDDDDSDEDDEVLPTINMDSDDE